MVSAAVSLTEPLREIKALFLREHPGIQIALNLGGSGLLQAQIEQGAPADVFISAGLPQMDRLVAGGFVDSASVRILARNHLVLIVPAKGAPPVHSLADLLHPDVRRIAIGNEKSVPAGQYAGETLRKMDLMDRIQEKLVPGEDVRQVVQYVATGAAEAGFVYLTDARTSAGVRIALTIPDETHSPIVYPIAPIARSDRARLAAEFVALALGPDGRAILVRYGFP
jgi:molybdate transport system substrate-binding protein